MEGRGIQNVVGQAPQLSLDPAGGVVLGSRVTGPLIYSVWVVRSDPPRAVDPPTDAAPRFVLDPQVRQLARRMTGNAVSDLEKANRVEAYLRQNYGYSLSGMTQQRADPVTWFLLRERQGHCEYFAGAMVALLNDLEIPARMVAGYSGGNLSFAPPLKMGSPVIADQRHQAAGTL